MPVQSACLASEAPTDAARADHLTRRSQPCSAPERKPPPYCFSRRCRNAAAAADGPRTLIRTGPRRHGLDRRGGRGQRRSRGRGRDRRLPNGPRLQLRATPSAAAASRRPHAGRRLRARRIPDHSRAAPLAARVQRSDCSRYSVQPLRSAIPCSLPSGTGAAAITHTSRVPRLCPLKSSHGKSRTHLMPLGQDPCLHATAHHAKLQRAPKPVAPGIRHRA